MLPTLLSTRLNRRDENPTRPPSLEQLSAMLVLSELLGLASATEDPSQDDVRSTNDVRSTDELTPEYFASIGWVPLPTSRGTGYAPASPTGRDTFTLVPLSASHWSSLAGPAGGAQFVLRMNGEDRWFVTGRASFEAHLRAVGQLPSPQSQTAEPVSAEAPPSKSSATSAESSQATPGLLTLIQTLTSCQQQINEGEKAVAEGQKAVQTLRDRRKTVLRELLDAEGLRTVSTPVSRRYGQYRIFVTPAVAAGELPNVEVSRIC